MTETLTDAARIGTRLRAARTLKGLTLDAVAQASGLTKGFVSKLERDQASCSVASLVTICEVVGLRIGDLFEPPRTQIVRATEGAQINFGGRGALEYLLTPGGQQDLQVIHSFIEPGGSAGDDLYSLDCDVEFVFVIAGSLAVDISHEVFILSKGDAMTFRARDPHTWRNASETVPSEVLWVLAPAP